MSGFFSLSRDTWRHRYYSYGALFWPLYTASHVESTAISRIGSSCSEPLNLLAKPGTALPHASFPIPLCAYAAMALHDCTPALSSPNRMMYVYDRARSHKYNHNPCQPMSTPQAYEKQLEMSRETPQRV